MPLPDNALPLSLKETAHLSAVERRAVFARLLPDFFDAQHP